MRAIGTKTPKAYVLWEGVPLENLGISDALVEASFGTTVARTKGTKVRPTGRPKVSQAQLTFNISDPQIAYRLAAILRQRTRPVVSLALGYEDGGVYWVGAFKLDKTSWHYDNEPNKVVLEGLTNKTLGLVEQHKPRVYEGASLRTMATEIAAEHGMEVEFLGSFDKAGLGIAYAIKPASESDWAFLARMTEQYGGAALYVTSSLSGGPTSARRDPSFYITNPNARAIAKQLRSITSNIRHVLHLGKYPGFMSVEDVDFTKHQITSLGYGPGLKDKSSVDFLVKSVVINEKGYKSGIAASSAQNTPEMSTFEARVTWSKDDPLGADPGLQYVQVTVGDEPLTVQQMMRLEGGNAPSQVARRGTRRANADASAAATIYKIVTHALPTEVDPDHQLLSARLAAIALTGGFTFTLEVELYPAVPYLRAPMPVRVVGTTTHDGLYGIEQAAIELTGKKGATSTLTLKPLKLDGLSNSKEDSDPSNFKFLARVARSVTGGFIDSYIMVGRTLKDSSLKIPKPKRKGD